MILANMINVDRYAVECDLAETYHIYNIYELPLKKVALFCVGLRDNSRIKIKLAGLKCSFETLLLAKAVDNLSLLVWSKTKDAEKNINRPRSIASELLENEVEQNIGFNSGYEFEEARKKLIKEGG